MELKNSREIPIGGKITKAGNAEEYNTGDWRTFKPVIDHGKCTNCLFCWMYCPDSSILVKDGKVTDVDYKHCKGCGICAEVCPRKCIKMEKG
ncbi:MAG: hypothetical protein A3J83_02060 [Elusimicrobia bacterium RIFOXYA2_FULL_40_6]|nr:MAG: hypothetical protein A3J83_02060 [Elusimicrobia bacterium RIFOXYA2_FULL_40_6]